MPSSDYKNAVGGGLKLKGAKDSGVDKKKKKKKPNSDPEANDSKATIEKSERAREIDPEDDSAVQEALADEEIADDVSASKQREDEVKQYGKTEAQRRHEERRRKRLDERLKREGVKTHKERVEELNKYLSKLSEHHDMPRIGPG